MGDAADDAYDAAFFAEYFGDDDGDYPTPVRFKTCQRCGESGLIWVRSGMRWKLADGRGYLHVCKPPAFEDLS